MHDHPILSRFPISSRSCRSLVLVAGLGATTACSKPPETAAPAVDRYAASAERTCRNAIEANTLTAGGQGENLLHAPFRVRSLGGGRHTVEVSYSMSMPNSELRRLTATCEISDKGRTLERFTSSAAS